MVLEPYVDSEHAKVWVKHAWWKLIHIKDKLKRNKIIPLKKCLKMSNLYIILVLIQVSK